MKNHPRWIPRVWELPPEVVERLGRQVGRQRSIYEKGHLLVILHALPKPGQDEREARVFWRAPDGNWKSNSGKGTGALAAHIAEYQAAIEELEQRENSAQSSEDFFSVLEIANPLARSSRNMHLALQQARDLVTEDSELISLRDEAYGVERGAELLVIDIRNGFDLYVARKTEEMTKSSHSMALAGHRLNLGHARADIARFSESTAR